MSSCTAIVLYDKKRSKDQKVKKEFPELPHEVMYHITSFLNAEDLARSSCVCKQWYAICSSERCWDDLLWSVYNISPTAFRPPRPLARDLYARLTTVYKSTLIRA